MNRIAEKILPVMNDSELDNVILASYENDAQTLTSDAEANLLNWKELNHRITDEETERWNEIKKTFRKSQLVKDDDQVGQVNLQLSNFADGLGEISEAISKTGGSSEKTLETLLSSLDKDPADSQLTLGSDFRRTLETHILELKNTVDAVRKSTIQAQNIRELGHIIKKYVAATASVETFSEREAHVAIRQENQRGECRKTGVEAMIKVAG